MKEDKKHIISERACLSFEELVAYHNHKLNEADAHLIEKHLVDCDLCSDALEGLEKAGSDKIKSIDARVAGRMKQNNNRFLLGIAASVAVILTTVGFLYLNNTPSISTEQLAMVDSIPKPEDRGSSEIADTVIQERKKIEKEAIAVTEQFANAEVAEVIQIAEKDAEENNMIYYDTSFVEELVLAEVEEEVMEEEVILTDSEEEEQQLVIKEEATTALPPLEVETRISKNKALKGYAYGTNTTTQSASFPGGEEKLNEYIKAEVAKYEYEVSGKVLILFDVTEKGKIEAIQVSKSSATELTDIATKVVEDMPRWEPAMKNEKPITTRQQLTISF